jgi:hypothetical protein
MRLLARSSFVGIALSAVIVACSGSGDSTGTTSGATTGGGATTCESTGKRICERACACGTDGKCKTGFKGSAGASTILTWSDQADCEAAFAGTRCAKGGPAGVDYAKCEADITAAACEADAFVDPPSCEAKRDGG